MHHSYYPECGNACYTSFEVLPGVYHIRCNYGATAFLTLLVGNTGALLVDTCYGFADLPGYIRSITDLPLTVVNSHGHSDHNGGNFCFPEVWMSHRDLKVTDWSRCEEISNKVWEFSPPPELGGFDFEAYLAYDPASTRPLEDGQVFDLGGMTVKTMLIGNHSPGSCAFYVPEKELLVAGDAVAPAVSIAYEESCSLEEHIRCLKALEPLPFRYLLSGHSERLVPREELPLYIECAENIEGTPYGRYRSEMMPSYRARMHYYTNAQGETAILILPVPPGSKR